MSRPHMLATYVGDKPAQPGEVVLVEVPHNCAIYEHSPRAARDILKDWFVRGAQYKSSVSEEEAAAAFEFMWNLTGVGGDFSPDPDEDAS